MYTHTKHRIGRPEAPEKGIISNEVLSGKLELHLVGVADA